MGKLISVSGNNAKLEMYAQVIKNTLKANGQKVFVVRQDWAGKKTISPYVAGMYDADKRYDLQVTIADKLADYDFVIVEGYTAQTIINNLIGFKTDDGKKSFCVWLDSLESVTYGIKRPDMAILVSENTHSGAAILASLFPNDFELYEQLKLPSIAKNLIEPSVQTDTYSATLLQLIELSALGKRNVGVIDESNRQFKDKKLQDIMAKHTAIMQTKDVPEFWELATMPLHAPARIKIQPEAYHAKTLEKLFADTEQSYGDNLDSIDITIKPQNEIELSKAIAWQYGAVAENLSYQEKSAVIETWAMHLNQSAANLLHIDVQAKLSWADLYTLLQALPAATADIQPPTTRYGFIDTEDCPPMISSKVEDLFDTATQYSLTENSDSYVLLGHITNARLHIHTKDVIYLLTDTIVGSKLLQKTMTDIKTQLSEKLPIFTTTITEI